MEEKQSKEFYLTFLLLVTGFCFLLFTSLLSIVDGVNIRLFGSIGGITFVSGLISGATVIISKVRRKNKGKLVP